MTIDLTGRTALVTGASRGIGAAIARGLGSAGARVAIHYNRNPELAKALRSAIGNGSAAFRADLSVVEEARHLYDEVTASFGRLDVVVNNAGVALHVSQSADLEAWEAAWDTTMAVNLKSLALISRLAVRDFVSQEGGGRLINIASRAAFRGDTSEYVAYAASKGGVVALTRSLARAYGKEGVRAFVIAPGFTETDMASTFTDEYGAGHALGDIALERLTTPEDIAPLVTLLASGLADHATGATFDINAGSYVR